VIYSSSIKSGGKSSLTIPLGEEAYNITNQESPEKKGGLEEQSQESQTAFTAPSGQYQVSMPYVCKASALITSSRE
jgi:hypothetical protein